MTLREVKEQLITMINAGSVSVDMKYDDEQVEAMIPSIRQEAISVKYNGSRTMGSAKRFNGAWVQKFEVTVDLSIQDNNLEYLIVNTPAPVSINKNVDGDIYLGKKSKTSKFYKCQTRDDLQTMKDRGFVNNGKQILYLNSDRQYEIYGDKMLKSFWREVVLANPIEKPNFDIENDEYPVTEDLLLVMVDIYKQKMGIAIQQVKDPVIDSTVTNERVNIKSNLR